MNKTPLRQAQAHTRPLIAQALRNPARGRKSSGPCHRDAEPAYSGSVYCCGFGSRLRRSGRKPGSPAFDDCPLPRTSTEQYNAQHRQRGDREPHGRPNRQALRRFTRSRPRGYVRYARGVIFAKATKTDKIREVPLSGLALQALEAAERMRRDDEGATGGLYVDCGLVFPNRYGKTSVPWPLRMPSVVPRTRLVS
jgi:hypothetical protein